MRMTAKSICGAMLLGGLAVACQQPVMFPSNGHEDLIVVATTDVHGRARGWDYYANAPDTLGGLSRVATIVDSIRKVSPYAPVVIDAGDIIQGNPLAYVAARVD